MKLTGIETRGTFTIANGCHKSRARYALLCALNRKIRDRHVHVPIARISLPNRAIILVEECHTKGTLKAAPFLIHHTVMYSKEIKKNYTFALSMRKMG